MNEATSPPPLDLDAIEKRANAASPGPWQTEPNTYAGRVWVQRSPVKHRWHGKDCEPLFNVRDKDGYEQREKDAVFIAHAREDVPALVAKVRALEAAAKVRPSPVILERANAALAAVVRTAYGNAEPLAELALMFGDATPEQVEAVRILETGETEAAAKVRTPPPSLSDEDALAGEVAEALRQMIQAAWVGAKTWNDDAKVNAARDLLKRWDASAEVRTSHPHPEPETT